MIDHNEGVMRSQSRRKPCESSDDDDLDDLAKFREAAVSVVNLPLQTTGRSKGLDNNVWVAEPKASANEATSTTTEKKSLRRDKNMVDENGFPQASSYFTPEFKDFVAKKLSEHMDRTFKVKTVKSPRLPPLSSSSSSSSSLGPASSSQDPLKLKVQPTTTHQSPLKSCSELENPSAPGPLDGDSSQRQCPQKAPGASTLPSSCSRSDVQSSSPINLSFNNDDSGVRLFSNGPKIRLPSGCTGPFGLPSSQDELVNDDGDGQQDHDDDDDHDGEGGGKRSNLLGKSKLTNSEKMMRMKKKRKKPDLLEAIKRRRTLLESELDPDGQVTSKLTSSKNKQNEEKKKKKKRKKKTAEKDPEKSNSPSSSSSSDDDNDDHDMGIHEAAVSTHWVLNKEGVYS